jgi:hypothetical protein
VDEMAKKESEFGRGLTYCIGLFLAHAEREMFAREDAPKTIVKMRAETWFNGASDHLYELDISGIRDKKLKKEIDNWRSKVLHWGHRFSRPHPDEVDMAWSIDKAKEFLRRIDEKLLKVKTIQGSWE